MKSGIVAAVLLVLLSTCLLSLEPRQDLDFVLRWHKPNPEKVKSATLSFREVSELKLLLITLLRGYQVFISSQDSSTCNFTVTCSRFAIQSIRCYGPLIGLLMTSDRLQRCNGLSRGYYPFDLRQQRSVDFPMAWYVLGKKLPVGD